MKDDYSDEIERRIDFIKRDPGLTDKEREKLLELHEEIQAHNSKSSAANQLGGVRHQTYLAFVHRLVRNTDAMLDALEAGNQAAVEAVGSWIDDTYDNGYTIDNYVSALRAWGRFLGEDARDDAHPERYEVVELGNVEDDQPAPKPSEVLFWSDIVTVLDELDLKFIGARTAAIIAMLWASGMRPMSEFWELTYGQIDDRGDHILISIESDSKTLARTIRIDVGLPYIRRWLNKHHPANETERGPQSETYLWTHGNKVELINYSQIRKSIKRVAEKTDLTKPVNPRHFRKSRASVLAKSYYVTQRDLEYHFGWVQGSRVAAHYIAVFNTNSRLHIAKADGADVKLEEEQEPIVPVWCDHCQKQTPRHRDTCLWCGEEVLADLSRQPRIGAAAGPTDNDDEQDLLDLLVSGDIEARDLRALRKLEPVIRRRDDLFDRLDSYIEHAEKLES
jgi:integrase